MFLVTLIQKLKLLEEKLAYQILTLRQLKARNIHSHFQYVDMQKSLTHESTNR